MATLILASLSACGGGGADPSGAKATTAAQASETSLTNVVAPSGMPESYRAVQSVPQSVAASAAAELPADPMAAYLKIWYSDPQSGEAVVATVGRWNPTKPLPLVQVPTAVQLVYVEIYNSAGNSIKEWKLT